MQLERLHHRMPARLMMAGGVAVLGRVAAADVAAVHAHPEMNPGVTQRDACPASFGSEGLGRMEGLQVGALIHASVMLWGAQAGA